MPTITQRAALVLVVAVALSVQAAPASGGEDTEAAIRAFRTSSITPAHPVLAEDAVVPEDPDASEEADEEKANWQPEEDNGVLPVSGWTDSLSGKIDSQASCRHIRDEIRAEQERFKFNTKKALEVAYGAKLVTGMEMEMETKTQHINAGLERSGCFQEDPEASRVSIYAVWSGGSQGAVACTQLFEQRSQVAAQYQNRVRSMMLSKQPKDFTETVDQLNVVITSLHNRLKQLGCEGR
jgi:hypothetical protein